MKKPTPYLCTTPGPIIILILVYIPVVTNIVYSFFSLPSYSSSAEFMGISNYTHSFTKDTPPIILKDNGLYYITSLVVRVGFGTLLTSLLESKATGRFRNVYRNIYYIPALTSLTAVGILLTSIHQPDPSMFNSFLRATGHGDMTRLWLGDSKIAIYCITAMSQWRFTGYITLLMVVTVQNVPNGYIEAAFIDSAGPVKHAFHIILPLTKEQLLVYLIIMVIGVSKLFIEVYSTTGGGPGNSTQILEVFLYQSASLHDDLGMAAVTDVFMFMVTMVLSLIRMEVIRPGEV